MGNTLLCRSIRSSTMRRYLASVSSFFKSHQRDDPTLTDKGERDARITTVLHEQSRWESMPNRRKPVTWELVDRLASTVSSTSTDSIGHAMVDWCTIGMYAGFRLSEWAQESRFYSKNGDVARNRDGSPTALVASDITFRDINKIVIPWSSSIDEATISFASIRWRFQKNGANGEILHYARHSNTSRCPVAALLRIRSRAFRLDVSPDLPVAVFLRNSKVEHITDVHIEGVLRNVAVALYKLTVPADIARFSSHSIRVGACVALHESD